MCGGGTYHAEILLAPTGPTIVSVVAPATMNDLRLSVTVSMSASVEGSVEGEGDGGEDWVGVTDAEKIELEGVLRTDDPLGATDDKEATEDKDREELDCND